MKNAASFEPILKSHLEDAEQATRYLNAVLKAPGLRLRFSTQVSAAAGAAPVPSNHAPMPASDTKEAPDYEWPPGSLVNTFQLTRTTKPRLSVSRGAEQAERPAVRPLHGGALPVSLCCQCQIIRHADSILGRQHQDTPNHTT